MADQRLACKEDAIKVGFEFAKQWVDEQGISK
jgi:hypothetical protein